MYVGMHGGTYLRSWKLNSGPLEKQQMLLITGQSLQAQFIFY